MSAKKREYLVVESKLTEYTPKVYKSLAEVNSSFTESTNILDIFMAMAAPSRLVCNISNSSVYPGTTGTLVINKTGVNTGNAMFMDTDGRVSTSSFTDDFSGGGGMNGTA